MLAGFSLIALLALALATRLVNLDVYTGKFDEGVRAEQLFLMSHGFRPVRDIFAAQGPLSLDIFYGPYVAFGQTLGAARSAVVLYSVLGLLAVFWVGSLGAGWLAGFAATALLVASPLFLKNSRLALLEIPAMVPAIVSVGGALLFQLHGERRYLLLSSAMLALALLIKPMILAVVAPLGLLLLLREKRTLSDIVIFGLVTLVLVGAVVLLYGADQVWQQVVGYRARARQSSDWSLRENWKIMSQELPDEQLAIYGMAAVSGAFLAITRPRVGLPLTAWLIASFGLLLVYSPLQFKHVAVLLPPLALVAGVGLTAMLRSPSRLPRLGLGALVVWYVISLPAIARQDWLVMSAATETRPELYGEETSLVSDLTTRDEFIIVDDPIVAFNAGRKVPPTLVDPSSYRIRSRALTGAEVVEASRAYDVSLLFLFSDGLRELDTFDRYVDERFRAIKIYERQNAKDRAIYLREDRDFAAARAVLQRDMDGSAHGEFGGELRLLGYNLARQDLRPGSSTSLTLHWEALRPMAVDYHVITRLRGSAGQPDFQSERALGGGGEGTASWEAGRWVFRSQSLAVPARIMPGEYRLSVSVYDSKSRTSPLVSAGNGAGTDELPLGQVRVR